MSEQTNALLTQAISLAKAGDKEAAREMIFPRKSGREEQEDYEASPKRKPR